MLNIRGVFYIWMILAFGACKNSADRQDTYIDSLMVAQIKYLSDSHPLLTKVARMGEKTDSVTFRPPPGTWKTEMDIFRQLSLFERASYLGVYQVKDGLPDEKSNLLIKQYVANKEVPIPHIRFYYYRQFTNLKRVEATYHQGNALYSTTRKLILEFDEVKGQPILHSYSIDGSQKMIFSDSVKFSVQSRITF